MSVKHTPVRPVLLLEMNEIPWRLLDRFRGQYPNIDKFFAGAKTYTTVAVDSGELSPWITWPSFHRGVSNREHGVQFLGQDPATFKGTPIWDEYRRLGHSVGICGSLQSWPPVNPGPGGFFIPDTFAHDERCIPSFVEPFQKFNLGQVARSGRVAGGGSVVSDELLPLLGSLPKLGIRPATVARVARQLVAERFDKTKTSRRPVFQTVLIWDVFKKLFDPKHPPAFSTFFTNHVAGVMHRYWDGVFPEDFGGKPAAGAPYLDTMKFGLQVTDDILADVFEFQAKNPNLVVVWASSMGQDAIHRSDEGGELTVSDTAELIRACGLTDDRFKVLLAMVPQVAISVPSPQDRARVKQALEAARTASGKTLFRVEGAQSSLSITLVNPKRADLQAGRFTLAGKTLSWAAAGGEAGVRLVQVDPGTAYHIPEGTMAVFGCGIAPDGGRERISAVDCKSMLMTLGGLDAVKTVKKPKIKTA